MTTITNTFSKLKEIEEVISLFHDDMTLMFGGFGGIGSPPSLIQAILEKGVTNLNLIGNDTGFPDVGIGRLVTNERVKSIITSHIGSNPNAGRQVTSHFHSVLLSDRKHTIGFPNAQNPGGDERVERKLTKHK